ncbi:SusD/RagB family nutrient-binding outer membrane lipoprotein [Algoriphagus sp. AK58]|uniref:SusD/RagB family nutrient-binding outer membrane lipoprotein n=1 Tax=Algoriphagus sp. AK58 TaxID=1406877 RepID=UPI00164F607D|nr:SusD/RagB family nutrient-binding outer membrane lipoprotein [Algoriphagus sp. AK58]MBC6366832.1 hypothetical protein [Algoriphagus sp. AK58]
MKNILNHKICKILAICTLLTAISCTEDWTEMNINPNQPSVVPASNIFGAGLTAVAGQLFGERIGIYYAGTWSGQLAAIGAGDYEFRVDINNGQWDNLFRGMALFEDARVNAVREGNNNLAAVSLIMKAFTAQQVSDMWGDIPYSEAFRLKEEGILNPVFDSHEKVYTQILKELTDANNMLAAGAGTIGVGDFMYAGDIIKWKKFANSLRLRVAMRMSNVAPQAAAAQLSQVLGNPAANPVFEVNSDNAYMRWPGIATNNIEPWRARLGVSTNKQDQYRTNHDLISRLLELEDPRLPVYADKNQLGNYNGYKMGIGQSGFPLNNNQGVSHIGNRFGYDDRGFSPFMHAAQVWFIKAEAHERGLVPGNAREAYERGITMAMLDNGIAQADIEKYLQRPEVAWGSGAKPNLEKIRLQNWISLYKQSVEAWSENRRTDVPMLVNVSNDYANNHNRPPFRMAYPANEIAFNESYPNTVKQVDIFYGDKLWWDTRQGVY